jgi:hypothetical protein
MLASQNPQIAWLATAASLGLETHFAFLAAPSLAIRQLFPDSAITERTRAYLIMFEKLCENAELSDKDRRQKWRALLEIFLERARVELGGTSTETEMEKLSPNAERDQAS